MTIEIKIFIEKDAKSYIEYISKLRIEVFREFPYLYNGDIEYEMKYMKDYTSDQKGMIAVAWKEGEIAGISTGIPLISESEIVAEAHDAFKSHNINSKDCYYYGEIIVLPKFRGLGITSKLYEAQDEIIKKWGFKHACILTVVRESDHPLKPKAYKSLDNMWSHLGFFKNNIRVEFHWPTIQHDGSTKDVKNTLEFWTKDMAKVPSSSDKQESE